MAFSSIFNEKSQLKKAAAESWIRRKKLVSFGAQERGCPLAPRVGRRGAEEEPSCGARGRQTDLCLQQVHTREVVFVCVLVGKIEAKKRDCVAL